MRVAACVAVTAALLLPFAGGAHAAAVLDDSRNALIATEAAADSTSVDSDGVEAPPDFLTFEPSDLSSQMGTSTSTASQKTSIVLNGASQVVEIRSTGGGAVQSLEENGFATSDSSAEITVLVDKETGYSLTGSIAATADPDAGDGALAFATIALVEQHSVGFGEAGTVHIDDSGVLAPGTWTLEVRAFSSAFNATNSASYELVLTFASTDPCEAPLAIIGTENGDALQGTPGDDVICAGGGDDLINGHGGSDIILGGNGNDVIVGGDVDETVIHGDFRGEAGNDVIFVGSGDNAISGGPGRDRITAGAGNDTIDGGADNDVIAAGRGNDVVSGGTGNDFICGGTATALDTLARRCGDLRGRLDGDDTIMGGDGDDSISGAGGNDVIDGEAGDDRIEGNSGQDEIDGGTGADVLRGGLGIDTLRGGADNDRLRGGPGPDSLFGEGGSDALLARDLTTDQMLDGGAGIDRARIDTLLDSAVGIEALLP